NCSDATKEGRPRPNRLERPRRRGVCAVRAPHPAPVRPPGKPPSHSVLSVFRPCLHCLRRRRPFTQALPKSYTFLLPATARNLTLFLVSYPVGERRRGQWQDDQPGPR